MNIAHQFMVKGILDSGIVEDGGPLCYAEIPKNYHVISGLTSLLIHLFILKKWSPQLARPKQLYHCSPNLIEKIAAALGIVSLILTFYYKFMTGKGIFIFNPCHATLIITVILLLSPTSDFTCKLHTCWTAWLFGAILALSIPHLYGITQFEIFLYYFEHLLIIPVGPWLLYRRYKFLPPGFKDQMASFSSMVLYQLGILLPICLATQVNLNFTLCHSPADPFYQHIGYHYFTLAVLVLNIFSYLGRWTAYLLVLPIKVYEHYRKPSNISRIDSNSF